MAGPSRLTSEGTNRGDFATLDWALLLGTSLIWGSSFLWIAIGLDSFHPGVIAGGRMMLGAAFLWLVPASRTTRIPREAWGPLAIVAIGGNMFPAIFFALAQQRVESSVAGMGNSFGPILTLVISIAMLRKTPERGQMLGLAVGMVGAVTLAAPNLSGADAEPVGLLFILLAVTGYSVSNNLLPPLAQTYGAPAVIVRAMIASAVLLAPWMFIGVGESTFSWSALAAVMILGIIGTGFARTTYATLVARVGAPRSSLVGYLVPVVAVVLGVAVRDESVGAVELVGTALILVGAWLISQARRDPSPKSTDER